MSGLEPACVNILVTQGELKRHKVQMGDREPVCLYSIVTPAGADIDLMLPHKTETVARPGTVN